MKNEQFHEMQEIQDTHFWYKARREIIESVLKTHDLLNNDFSVLEIGSATGTNISYFKDYFRSIKGSEINNEAIRISSTKLPEISFVNGWLPDNIGYENEKFDLIFLFDVLEHIENDLEALSEIKKRLTKNGKLILTVPAYQFLFGPFDVEFYHFRRYNSSNLTSKLKSQNFKILYKSYFNFWLFPLVLVSRLLDIIKRKSSGSAVDTEGNKFVNSILYKIMSTEKSWLGRKLRFPFGSSLIVIAE